MREVTHLRPAFDSSHQVLLSRVFYVRTTAARRLLASYETRRGVAARTARLPIMTDRRENTEGRCFRECSPIP